MVSSTSKTESAGLAQIEPGSRQTRGFVPGRPALGAILVSQGKITEAQLQRALQFQVESGCRLGEALTTLELSSDVDIARSLAAQFEMPYVDLSVEIPSPECVASLPREVALLYGVLPIREEGGHLLAAVRDPFDIRVDQVVAELTGKPVRTAIAPEAQLREQLIRHYSDHPLVPSPVPADDVTDLGTLDERRLTVERLAAASQEMPTVQVVNSLISDAIRRGASDIHIEPEGGAVRVRYRLDGRLRTILTLAPERFQSIAARTKIISGMDISETRLPQDGAAQVRVDHRIYELRVSTLPGIYGEVIVIRVLCQDPALAELDELGLEPPMLHRLRRVLSAKEGMLLVTGPTGSGKTTTLYAALGFLNTDEVNIITVEDPVEIKLPSVNQTQVSEKAGRTFASALRSILRQDPDIIMVGEVRDGETAEIALRAALTGHLVLSTLHTRDALGTVSRLRDMGVPMYIVTAALNAAISQRLLRRVCNHCVEDYNPPAQLRQALEAEFGIIPETQFRHGRGCQYCSGSGLRGRVGVYELLVIDEQLRQLLNNEAPEGEIDAWLHTRGFQPLEYDAYVKACRGVIPPEEVLTLGLSVAQRHGGGILELGASG